MANPATELYVMQHDATRFARELETPLASISQNLVAWLDKMGESHRHSYPDENRYGGRCTGCSRTVAVSFIRRFLGQFEVDSRSDGVPSISIEHVSLFARSSDPGINP